MKPGEKTGGIIGHINGIMPPGPGQEAFYVCHDCGKTFIRKIPRFFDFGAKCPECGSYKVDRDQRIVN